MVDLSPTIIAKSDQLNSDDLMGGPITVQITRVSGTSDKEQPIAISYQGDQNKPYKPGKSMRRVLVAFWGKDGEGYVGRSLTLYRDPEVTFGKIKVGGIRISHMSDIEDGEMALAVKKGAKALFSVKRLDVARREAPITAADILAMMETAAGKGTDELRNIWAAKSTAPFREQLAGDLERLKGVASNAEKVSPETGEIPQTVFDDTTDEQRGEMTALDSAKAQLDDAPNIMTVNSRVGVLRKELSEEDGAALAEYAMGLIAEMKAN